MILRVPPILISYLNENLNMMHKWLASLGHTRLGMWQKGMEHFPRNNVKLPYESIMRATYEFSAKDDTR